MPCSCITQIEIPLKPESVRNVSVYFAGNSKYSTWNFDFPRRMCYRPHKHTYSAGSCPICRDHWYPMYTDVDKIKQYIDPKTNRFVNMYFK